MGVEGKTSAEIATMESFASIWARAAQRKGGEDALEAQVAAHKPKTREALAAIPDDRWFSTISRGIFQAGFSWKVIADKWPGFEAAFDRFDPVLCAAMSDDAFDALLKNRAIVRNAQKILAVRDNGAFLVALAREHGTAAAFFADWPDSDYVGLLEVMRKRGSRLGGGAAMWVLRNMGKPSFVLSRDVVAALIAAGVVDREPSGKRDTAAVQAAFNAWAAESGRDLTSLSRVLALSIGPQY
jgi:3-methyladenine DNA glycosylase Tag